MTGGDKLKVFLAPGSGRPPAATATEATSPKPQRMRDSELQPPALDDAPSRQGFGFRDVDGHHQMESPSPAPASADATRHPALAGDAWRHRPWCQERPRASARQTTLTVPRPPLAWPPLYLVRVSIRHARLHRAPLWRAGASPARRRRHTQRSAAQPCTVAAAVLMHLGCAGPAAQELPAQTQLKVLCCRLPRACLGSGRGALGRRPGRRCPARGGGR